MDLKVISFFLLILCMMNRLYSQDIDCKAIYLADSVHYMEYISSPLESFAIPYGSFKIFYQKLIEQTQAVKEEGKVFVRFVVDTLGTVHCAKVFKSDNENLNSRALEIINKTKFTPATQRDKKVNAPMVLPIMFGKPPKKPRRKN